MGYWRLLGYQSFIAGVGGMGEGVSLKRWYSAIHRVVAAWLSIRCACVCVCVCVYV